MYYYAQTKDPGEGTVYTYENIWDAHKMYGCNCDDDYEGFGCELRRCPVGDDPMTGNGADTAANPVQYNEQQQITCKAGAGTFTLSFRGKTTVEIDYNADVTTVTSALENLPTLGKGHVTVLMSGSQACTESVSSSTSFTVEFLQEFGSLPLLVTDSSKLSMLNAISGNVVLTAAKQIDGTKESKFCSGRGIAIQRQVTAPVTRTMLLVMATQPLALAVIVDIPLLQLQCVPEQFPAVAMASVLVHPRIGVLAPTGGRVVTAVNGLAQRTFPGSPCPAMTTRHIFQKSANVLIWAPVIVMQVCVHVTLGSLAPPARP